MVKWSLETMPDQHGKIAIVTGANSGIGYYTALELARAGANVILACRSADKGIRAAAQIQAAVAGASVQFEPLDLASLDSVRAFCTRFRQQHAALDLLINNAGLMAIPRRQLTVDGFEMQFGVNFLGHFLLTALLLPALMKAPAPRVVQLSSLAHRRGSINLADLQAEQTYKPMRQYSQSKLAMLMLGLELQRRSDAGGWRILSLAAHPGFARTEILTHGRQPGRLATAFGDIVGPLFTNTAAQGALPTLAAATAPDAGPGGYYGPGGFQEIKGPPDTARIGKRALDKNVAAQLWSSAETLTRQTFAPPK